MMSPEELAAILVENRRSRNSITEYPCDIPTDLEFSYQVQDCAINLWADEIIGWKIGRLAPEIHAKFGTERLTGPIFLQDFQIAKAMNQVQIFKGGFAAMEAEYVFRVKKDFPKNGIVNSVEFPDFIDEVYAGVEMAGSPIYDINAFGPTVVASDFGNNNGLICGQKLFDILRPSDLNKVACEKHFAASEIEGETVGKGGLFSMPNGPIEAVLWLGQHLANRGLMLKKGMLISSGASTGIHEISNGQRGKARFSSPRKIETEINIVASF